MDSTKNSTTKKND
jgi:hypothetical protein